MNISHNKKICCFHLLNDYSGSPHVLSIVVKMLVEMGHSVHLNTSKTNGFLSKIEGVAIDYNLYKWKGKNIFQFLLIIFVQLQLFFVSILKYRKYDIFYINTIHPFGAAIVGKLLKKRIIYHIHEKYINPNILQKFAYWVMKKTASQVIFVSEYLKDQYIELGITKGYVIYNTLSLEFVEIADRFVQKHKLKIEKIPMILMITSLKIYKGIQRFIELAKRMPQYDFYLIANATDDEVTKYQEKNQIPNLYIYPAQSNVHPFYQKAQLLVNLSLPTQWIETFGLTILEGMRYGLPIIAPPVGGPTELVIDGVNGFLLNSEDIDSLQQRTESILSDADLYMCFSTNSFSLSQKFDYNAIYQKIRNIVDN